MENGQVIYPKRRICMNDYREAATRGSWSVIFVVLALVAIRPIMVKQILSRADAYAAFGLDQESERQCSKALLLDSNNSQAWCQLARIHKARGNRELAYEAYQKSTLPGSTNGPAHFELGLMYVEDEYHQQAIPHFEQVRMLGPDRNHQTNQSKFAYHKAALDMLALCYEKTGHTSKAEFTLEEIRVYYPHYTAAQARLDRLKERRRQ